MSSDRRHPFRPLLPAAPVGGGGASSPDAAAEPPPQASKRKKTPAACTTCRQRKIKCDGATPRCGTCARCDVDCAYAAALGSQELLRRLAHTHGRLAMHEELYERLRSRAGADARRALDQIRRGLDVETVLRGWDREAEKLAAPH